MTEAVVLDRPADSAEEGITYGGFADIARRLNALHPERSKPISRQLVERWWKCRGSNGMPDREPIEGTDGKVKPLFNLQDVETWHAARKRTRDPKPPIETIPLFRVDARGAWTPEPPKSGNRKKI